MYLHLNRIATEHEVEAMVAGDTFDLLVERVARMVSAGRPMVLAVRECTYTHRPPKIYSRLRLDTESYSGGFWTDRRPNHLWFGVVLTDGTGGYDGTNSMGFGADVYSHSGNQTEREAWTRYNEHEAEHDNHFRRRRDMTHIAIVGGIPGRRYHRDDSIVVSEWNGDGVCTEKTLGFEVGDGSW